MSISKLLDHFTLHTVVSAVIAAISGLNIGWHISVPNMPQKVITTCSDGLESPNSLPACLPMSDSVWGITVGTFALGGLVGSLGSSYLNNRFSRKTNIMIAGLWMIFGGLLSLLSINIGMYTIGRVFVGVSAGLSGSCVGIYVSEIATNENRGALGCLYELFLNLGILLTQVAGLYMSYVPVWRYLWAIPTMLAVVQLVGLYFFCTESPRYLVAIGKNEQAKAAFFKLRGHEDHMAWLDFESSKIQTVQKEKHVLAHMAELFKDKWIRKMMFVVTVVCMYNQIGGVGPMSVYSVGFLTTVFQGNAMTATTVTLISSAAGVVATLISVIAMHRVGRKGFMLISTAGMTIGSVFLVIGSALPNTSQLAPLSITASILFIFTYSMGCGVIPWMIAPELLPLNALPIGTAIANSCNWLINFVVNTVWSPMNAGLEAYSFVVFAVINFIGFLFVLFLMPETTGKDLDVDSMDKDTILLENDVEYATAAAKN